MKNSRLFPTFDLTIRCLSIWMVGTLIMLALFNLFLLPVRLPDQLFTYSVSVLVIATIALIMAVAGYLRTYVRYRSARTLVLEGWRIFLLTAFLIYTSLQFLSPITLTSFHFDYVTVDINGHSMVALLFTIFVLLEWAYTTIKTAIHEYKSTDITTEP